MALHITKIENCTFELLALLYFVGTNSKNGKNTTEPHIQIVYGGSSLRNQANPMFRSSCYQDVREENQIQAALKALASIGISLEIVRICKESLTELSSVNSLRLTGFRACENRG
uniref:Uncharacterized protein n=1 Tax=Megaselia scalaris TaxID=36166 RepID=T1H1J4_MEGSC